MVVWCDDDGGGCSNVVFWCGVVVWRCGFGVGVAVVVVEEFFFKCQ